MSAPRVAVLTPPGQGAIAVLSIQGAAAWPVIRQHFRTLKGAELPADPAGLRFWVGRFGAQAADEVVLSIVGPDAFEIHCHGGTQIVSWLLALLRANGLQQLDEAVRSEDWSAAAFRLLPLARTLRTASILLDQANGAYPLAFDSLTANSESIRAILRRNAGIGRHLIDPWQVAIAGAPNAGKSSLLNALAGFDRTIVSPIPGTTRDAVSVPLAFDGWPVDLIDTAGIRNTPDELEQEGVRRAKAATADCDLCLWIVDATGPLPTSADAIATELGLPSSKVLVVLNKTDLIDVPPDVLPDAPRVSAVTGQGLDELAARVTGLLVPDPPLPGEPVPFTPELCDRWS